MLKKLLGFFCTVVLVTCDAGRRHERARKSRFISFNAEKSDIAVGLDFAVPFLSIPVKNSAQSIFGGQPDLDIPIINFNPTGLAFGGFMVLASTVFIPLLTKSLYFLNTDRSYRVLDSESDDTNILMDMGSKFMSVSSGCPLSIACSISQNSNAGETRTTLEQIVRNKLVSSVMNTTAIEEAIKHGRKGYDCSRFGPCPIREDYLLALMSNFATMRNSRNKT